MSVHHPKAEILESHWEALKVAPMSEIPFRSIFDANETTWHRFAWPAQHKIAVNIDSIRLIYHQLSIWKLIHQFSIQL